MRDNLIRALTPTHNLVFYHVSEPFVHNREKFRVHIQQASYITIQTKLATLQIPVLRGLAFGERPIEDMIYS